MAAVGLTLGHDAYAGLVSKGPCLPVVEPTHAELRIGLRERARVAVVVRSLSDPSWVPIAKSDGGASTMAAMSLSGLKPGQRYEVVVRPMKGDPDTVLARGEFSTPPEKFVPFSFVMFGEAGADPAAFLHILPRMRTEQPAFWLHAGDWVKNGEERDKDWASFFGNAKQLFEQAPLFSVVGHQAWSREAGTDALECIAPLAGTIDGNRVIEWSNVALFLFNGGPEELSHGKALPWLKDALEQSKSHSAIQWRIVLTRQGLHSSGPTGSNAVLLVEPVASLLRDAHVDLLLASSDRMYERGSGVVPYVLSGGAGAPLDPSVHPHAALRKFVSENHYVRFDVRDSEIALTAIRHDGSALDSCVLRKQVGWTCDGAPSTPPLSTLLSGAAASADASAPVLAPQPAKATPMATRRFGCSMNQAAPSSAVATCSLLIAILAMRRTRRHALVIAAALSAGCGAAPRPAKAPSTPAQISVQPQLVSASAAGNREQLRADARSAAEIKDWKRVTELMGTLCADSCDDSDRLALAVAHDKNGEYAASTRLLAALANTSSDAGIRREAQLRQADVATFTGNLQDLEAAEAQLSAFPASDTLFRVALYAVRGRKALVAGDDAKAMHQVQDGLELAEKAKFGDAGAPPTAVTALRFLLGEVRRTRGERILFDGATPEEFMPKLEARCGLMMDAQRAYTDAIRGQDIRWAGLAGYTIGEVYSKLHADVMRVPSSKRANTDEKKQLHYAMMHVRYRVLLEKGLDMMDRTIELADKSKEKADWAAKAKEARDSIARAIEEEKRALAGMPYSEEEVAKALDILKRKAIEKQERERDRLMRQGAGETRS